MNAGTRPLALSAAGPALLAGPARAARTAHPKGDPILAVGQRATKAGSFHFRERNVS
jgi:hypothetical protein